MTAKLLKEFQCWNLIQ